MCISLLSLSIISTAIRLYTRRFMTVRCLRLDDHLVVIALVLELGWFATDNIRCPGRVAVLLCSHQRTWSCKCYRWSSKVEFEGNIALNTKTRFFSSYHFSMSRACGSSKRHSSRFMIRYSFCKFPFRTKHRPMLKRHIRLAAVILGVTLLGCFL